MRSLADIVLLGWPLLVVLLFLVIEPRRAVIISMIAAWLFLPNSSFVLAGFPDYDKMNATVLSIVVGALLRDPDRILRFRPSYYDIPIVLYCIAPFASSITNGLGAYDGMSGAMDRSMEVGGAYFVGRIYFNTLPALRELAIGIFIGGLIYAPLCLWEIRMSPRLHLDVYGFRARPFFVSIRYGGYRPIVFMWGYLAVIHWMILATVIGFRLRLGARMRQLCGVPMVLLLGGMVVTLVLSKVMVAAILVPLGIAVPIIVSATRSTALFMICVLAVPGIIGLRAAGIWSAEEVVEIVESVDARRAQSLGFRVRNENEMAAKARQRPWFGWGGYGRMLIYDRYGETRSVIDGKWIIEFGNNGLLGLCSYLVLFSLPLIRFCRVVKGALWAHPAAAPAAALATCVMLTLVNSIPNLTSSPVVAAIVGGLTVLKIPRHSNSTGKTPRMASALT